MSLNRYSFIRKILNKEVRLITVSFLLITIGLVSCSFSNNQDYPEVKSKIKALSANGKHGYFVATYLIGRIRSNYIDIMPVTIVVTAANRAILEKPINFKIQDTTSYTLSYTFETYETIVRGEFEKPLVTNDFQIIISKNKSFNEVDNLSILKILDYELKIFKY